MDHPLPTNAADAAVRPNVVIFLADDSGWGDYSHQRQQQVRTPNIDSIARGGASLDRFFVCAVCAPTRAEFLTGRYHSRGGVRGVSTGQERLNTDEKTLADAFKAAGYATGASANGTTAASGRIIRTRAGSTSITDSPPGTGANTSIRRWSTTAVQSRGKGYIADDFTRTRSSSSSEPGEAVPLLRSLQHAALAVGRAG